LDKRAAGEQPELIWEVWVCPDSHSIELSPASAEGDELRAKIDPNAVRAHVFSAHSDHEAFQKHYELQGWGTWQSDGYPANFATQEQAEKQEQFLASRAPIKFPESEND
jgi:hypothetical protein